MRKILVLAKVIAEQLRRMTKNKIELLELKLEVGNIVKDIKAMRLSWLGYVLRTQGNRTIKDQGLEI